MNGLCRRSKLCLTLLSLWIAHPAAHALEVGGLGFDFEGDPTKTAFTFHRKEKIEDGKRVVDVTFNDPSGKIVLEERIIYKDATSSIDFETYTFKRHQNTDTAHVSIKDEKLWFDVNMGGKPKTDKETLAEGTVIRDTLIPYLTQHWDELVAGKKVKARFVHPERAETIGFNITKESEETLNGVPAVKMKLRPSSLVIALIAGNSYFWMEKNGAHRILRSDGRQPVLKDTGGGKLKNITGRIDFTYSESQPLKTEGASVPVQKSPAS